MKGERFGEKPREVEKSERYRELLHGSPDAIFVLSGGIKVRERPGAEPRITTTAYSDDEKGGLIIGGKARVIAAAEVGPYFPEAKIVTTSAPPNDPESNAKVMAQELEHHGIPSEQIVLEEKSVNTLTEIKELVRMAAANGWKKVAVITSDYHVPRSQEILQRLETYADEEDTELVSAVEQMKSGKIEVSFVAAEEILPLRSEHYRTLIEKVHQSAEYRKRVEAEQRGLQQLRSGTYGKGR